MKVIIAGSRTITDYFKVKHAMSIIEGTNIDITEVICGEAKGVDLLGKRWAEENNIPVESFPVFPSDWNKYGKRAGHIRNKKMVDYAKPDGALVAIWDGVSKGTLDTINLAKNAYLLVYIYNTKDQKVYCDVVKRR